MQGFKDIIWSPIDDELFVLAEAAGEELSSRLSLMTLTPQGILDVGCGRGKLSRALKARYPEAAVTGIDLSAEMIAHAKAHDATGTINYLEADASALPFASASFDLISANFLLPWQEDITGLLKEWRRLLRPAGMLILSALGPDTLKECKTTRLASVVDMHDLGDLLLQTGFSDPVLDVDYYTITYHQQAKMHAELKATHMVHANAPLEFLEKSEDDWALTYEVIYVHTFLSDRTADQGSVSIPLSQLRSQLKMKV